MKINKLNTRKGFTLVELLVVIAIIAALAALSTPAVTKALKKAALTTSISNCKQIKTALDLFASDWDGEFVNDTNSVSLEGTADSAAAAYTCLILNGNLDASDEALFYTKELIAAGVTHQKPNNDGTLEAAECGYSYVKGLFNTSTGATPIVSTQLSAESGTFYSDVWDHRAIVARVNGSVASLRMTGVATAGGSAEVQETVNGAANTSIFQWIPQDSDIIQILQ